MLLTRLRLKRCFIGLHFWPMKWPSSKHVEGLPSGASNYCPYDKSVSQIHRTDVVAASSYAIAKGARTTRLSTLYYEFFPFTRSPFRKAKISFTTSFSCSCITQCPAPLTSFTPRNCSQLFPVTISSTAPGV